jgi:hypothetical protein
MDAILLADSGRESTARKITLKGAERCRYDAKYAEMQYPGLVFIGYCTGRIALSESNIMIDDTLPAKPTDAPSN